MSINFCKNSLETHSGPTCCGASCHKEAALKRAVFAGPIADLVRRATFLLGAAFVLTGWDAAAAPKGAPELKPSVHHIAPGEDLQYRLQTILIQAVPGDVIQFEAGRFQLQRQIDIATDNITLRGQGSDKTVISFRGQLSGGQGIEATGNNLVIEGMAIEDTAGNAVKVLGARNVTFRDLRTEWTGKAKSSNGAYGIYPVQCDNVLVEECQAYGASDAGLYVGQCRRVIVRDCRAERNVAGIEIENTIDADVYNNVATNNAGGLLVFDLPGLPQKAGRNVRVFRNRVFKNNHVNFAAPGNMVAGVPQGTGVMIMATSHVEVFDNDIADNQTGNMTLVSYLIMGKKKRKDTEYQPIPLAVSIHHNRFSGGGESPAGELGPLLALAVGTPLPDILFDGMLPPHLLVDGELPTEHRHAIFENGDASFANFNLPTLTPSNLQQGKVRIDRDLAPYQQKRPALKAVKLVEHDPPEPNSSRAVHVYRAAPRYLSEWGLFEGDGSSQTPAAGVEPYDLNTTLFSDYTKKQRFIRVPDGAKIDYAATGPLEFPDGTVIAKTFSYPHDMQDESRGERLLETRVEFLQEGAWYGYSYLWNDEQTEATLALGGGEVAAEWVHHDGTTRHNQYVIPNANACISCHSEDKQYVPIGPTAANMNRQREYDGQWENQLEHLAEHRLLEGLPDETDRPRLVEADDPATGKLADRARAWLHVNCAHCHSPSGTAHTSGLDLRLSQSDPTKLGYFKPPVAAGHGSGGLDYDIVPGKPDESILLYRIESADPSIRMPTVGRNLAPAEGAELVRGWIADLAAEAQDQ